MNNPTPLQQLLASDNVVNAEFRIRSLIGVGDAPSLGGGVADTQWLKNCASPIYRAFLAFDRALGLPPSTPSEFVSALSNPMAPHALRIADQAFSTLRLCASQSLPAWQGAAMKASIASSSIQALGFSLAESDVLLSQSFTRAGIDAISEGDDKQSMQALTSLTSSMCQFGPSFGSNAILLDMTLGPLGAAFFQRCSASLSAPQPGTSGANLFGWVHDGIPQLFVWTSALLDVLDGRWDPAGSPLSGVLLERAQALALLNEQYSTALKSASPVPLGEAPSDIVKYFCRERPRFQEAISAGAAACPPSDRLATLAGDARSSLEQKMAARRSIDSPATHAGPRP